MSHITQELKAFEAWFQDVWLGDFEYGQRIPTAISDPLYPRYLEHHQLALGAWMHRAALAQPEQAGFVLVPIEPTLEMLANGDAVWVDAARVLGCIATKSIYKAMLEAAKGGA